MVEKYLQEIFQKYRTGQAVERSYYPVLENFLIDATKELGNYSILIEAKRSSVGIPDFKIQDEKELLIGYIEAKDVGRDLDHLSAGENEQIAKYIKEYEKLIVTNFTEFRLYEDHKLVEKVTLTEPVTLQIGQPVLQNEATFRAIFERFLYTPVSQIYTSKRLSEVLAKKTHTLRDLILEEINLEDDTTTKTEELLETFRKTLDPEMTAEKFSDMYAQTITFGLFVARINSDDNEFTRFSAYKYIPNTISLLKEIFKVLSWQDLPSHIEWSVDEIVETLAYTKIEKITDEFFSKGKWRDPIIHFYETFLASYDPREREKRGVYYTPQPVVSYITRSVHQLLKEKFDIQDGFADPSVQLLDPAGGTLTFPAEAIAVAKEEFVKRHGDGGWKRLVKDHILKNFYAFELLMAPYAIGHLKIALLLKELGYEMEDNDRFRLYLTNTLDFKEVETLPLLMLAKEITEESKDAYEVKTKEKIMVIMGNPPYSGHSENKGDWILEQMKEYKKVNGQPLGEKNPKWLNDDYVKFIRFAQWKIEQSKTGILGFITNHAWLDNPTFRGMRSSLLKSFDEIYVLNLHGSMLKKERTPTDGKDENVFDITTGVAITLCVKTSKRATNAKVYYQDLWGLREGKYKWLDEHTVENTDWENITPSDPSYYFIKRDETGWKTYKNFVGINDIFPVNSVGIVTSRDDFVIDFDKDRLMNRIRTFIDSQDNGDVIKNLFNLKENKSWNISKARTILHEENDWQKYIHKITYRPLDERWIFYHPAMIERPRMEVMDNFLNKNNLGLIVNKKVEVGKFNHAFLANNIIESHSLSLKEINYLFPLYKYNNADQPDLLNSDTRTSNLVLDIGHEPEEVFNYIYAVLYSNIYREKYQEFLKTDFPRIPFTKDEELFRELAKLGEELVQLHLLKHPTLDNPISKFNGEGDGLVNEIKYYETTTEMSWPSGVSSTIHDGIIKINGTQYFDNVSPDVWNYYIGGYQVLAKWLKYRVGRRLTLDDGLHYRKVITALSKTIKIQEKIDKLYPQLERTLT